MFTAEFNSDVASSEWWSLIPPVQIRCLGFVLPLQLLFPFIVIKEVSKMLS